MWFIVKTLLMSCSNTSAQTLRLKRMWYITNQSTYCGCTEAVCIRSVPLYVAKEWTLH